MESLDAVELLHLGLHATEHDEPARAIEYLKRCLALEPGNARATYLLGAMYAQVGLYDRAKETLARAIDLNGDESTAIFQLGLLHVTSGEIGQADGVWNRLDALPEDHAFNLFRRGVLALVNDDFATCEELLDRGIVANTFNEALNNDMSRLKASAAAAREQALQLPVAESSEVASSGHHLLGSYRQRSRH